MVSEDSRLQLGRSPLLTPRAIALSEQFEEGVSSVYLPSAHLRVSASVPYSDTYTLDEITFWQDEQLVPGQTKMPFPDYLLEIWKKFPGPDVKEQDFRSADEVRIFSVSCNCRPQSRTLFEFVAIANHDVAVHARKLDGLAAKFGEKAEDLFIAGLLAVFRLPRWEARALQNDSSVERIMFVMGGDLSGLAPSPDTLLALKEIAR